MYTRFDTVILKSEINRIQNCNYFQFQFQFQFRFPFHSDLRKMLNVRTLNALWLQGNSYIRIGSVFPLSSLRLNGEMAF